MVLQRGVLLHKRLLLFGVVFSMVVLTLPSLHAISLSGPKLGTLIYVPGESVANIYTISDTDFNVTVTLSADSEIKEFIRLEPLSTNQYLLTVEYPRQLISPGTYWFAIEARETAASSAGISSVVAAVKRFKMEVYSPGKEVAVSLTAPSVNRGTPVSITLTIESRGYQDIASVKGTFFLADSLGTIIGTRTTDTASLPALESVSFTEDYPTDSLLPAEYSVRAEVLYDGRQVHANTSFAVGSMDVEILNYTSQFVPGFNTLSIAVRSRWGQELHNVHALLLLEGNEMVQTPSITLPPWGDGLLQSIVLFDLEPGTYNGTLRLFYEGEMKEEPFVFSVVDAPQEHTDVLSMGMVVLFVLAIAILLVVLFIFMSKKRGRRKMHDDF